MTNSSIIIAPSILSADLSKLQEEVDSIEQFADWLQIDVMDGQFVPNLSFGAPVIKNLKTKLLLDIHLMVEDPQERIEEFLKAGAKHITFHAETVKGTDARKSLIKAIRDGGATAGIAINPDTPLDEVEDVLGEVDLLLVMSVNPGFGGQNFITEVLEKVRTAREKFPDLMIQMDGGVDSETASKCIKAGANNLVSGSFIFKASDREAAITSLRS
ncbi:ribulose-phosphate 3-epimerase [Patescibacteria group bacterium]|nr:ribulose-phosphate 3-epimerase [Patescibacteria group bacterium]